MERQKGCKCEKSITILGTPFLDHHKSAIIRKTADINMLTRPEILWQLALPLVTFSAWV